MKRKFSIALTKVSLSAIAILLVFASAQEARAQTCVQPPSGLVSWWPGDGNADDISGNLLNGIAAGGVTFPQGVVGPAFQFDGIDGRVEIVDSPLLRFGTGDLTIDAWIKAPPGTSYRTFIGKEQQTYPGPSILFRLDQSGRVEFAVTDCGTGSCGWFDSRQPVVSPAPIDDNAFHHIAGVRRSTGTYELYIDGQLVAVRVESARDSDSAASLFIGTQAIAIAPFDGIVDEVDIFNRALSLTEIQAIYSAGSAGKCKSDQVTVAHWKFEEGVADTAAVGNGTILDSSGNGLHGTPFDSPIYRDVPNPNSTLGLQFNNSLSQRVFVPDNVAFELTHSLTLEAFIRYDGIRPGTQYYSQIVFRGDSRGATDPYFLAVDLSGHLVFQVEDAVNNQSKVVSPNPIPPGFFLHVAGTLDDTTGEQKLFINGVEVASQVTNIRPFGPLEPFINPGIGIGNVQDDFNYEAFTGIIDEVRISQNALSPSEFLNAAPTGQKPVANAGADQAVERGSVVQLDGSLSRSPAGNPLQYQWKFLSKPGGSTAVLSSQTAARPTFTADLPGTYAVELIVNDGQHTSDPDTVVISVRSKTKPPRPAITAPARVKVGDTVHLSVTDPANPNTPPLIVEWVLITKPQGSRAQLTVAGQAASFKADVAGNYAVKVIVTNANKEKGQAAINIQAVTGNVPPQPDPVNLTCELKKSGDWSWYECNRQQVSQTAYFVTRLSDLNVIRNIVIWQFDSDALTVVSGEAYYVNDLRTGRPLVIRQLTQKTLGFARLDQFQIHSEKTAIWRLTEDAVFDDGAAYYAACLVGTDLTIRQITPQKTFFGSSINKFTVNGNTAQWEFCQGIIQPTCRTESAALPNCPLP